jgi:hypothetical protein
MIPKWPKELTWLTGLTGGPGQGIGLYAAFL